MSREQDFLLGAIEKDKVIAQQQARIEALTLEVACLSDGPTTDEWQEWLAAERERADQLIADRDEWQRLRDAEREKSAALHQRFAEAVQYGNRMGELAFHLHPDDDGSNGETWKEYAERLEALAGRYATLLHNSHHNWALHSVVDCPELECEEYRALLSPAPEEK